MKIQVLSDLHLEFSAFDPPQTDADVVVLAGDIALGSSGTEWARREFPSQPIIYVPGNHEYYRSQRPEMLNALREDARRHNVHLLDNDEIVIGGVRFLGCTLWTDFELFGVDEKPWAMRAGERGLNDFRLIKEDSLNTFTPMRSFELHAESLRWLTMRLGETFSGKTVVVTHHLPSRLSVVDRYKDVPLSACFASELGHLFGMMDLWIHGHTHDSLDYVVEGTRVICNPRGYVMPGSSENLDFDPQLVVTLA